MRPGPPTRRPRRPIPPRSAGGARDSFAFAPPAALALPLALGCLWAFGCGRSGGGDSSGLDAGTQLTSAGGGPGSAGSGGSGGAAGGGAGAGGGATAPYVAFSASPATALAATSAGQIVVIGQAQPSGGNRNIVVSQYDTAGSRLWSESHNGPENYADGATAFAVTAAGEALVGGYVNGGVPLCCGRRQAWLGRFSPEGVLLHERTLPEDDPTAIAAAGDQVAVLGEDGWLGLYEADAPSPQWSEATALAGGDLAFTADGDLVVVGTRSLATDAGAVRGGELRWYSAVGELLSTHAVDNAGRACALRAVARLGDDAVVVGTLTQSDDSEALFAARVSGASGTERWRFVSDRADAGADIAVTPSGGLVVAGRVTGEPNRPRPYLVELSSGGEPERERVETAFEASNAAGGLLDVLPSGEPILLQQACQYLGCDADVRDDRPVVVRYPPAAVAEPPRSGP